MSETIGSTFEKQQVMKMRSRIPILLVVSLLCTTNLLACNIPVFRYALEHWRPDSLEILAFSNDAILDVDRQLLDSWRKQAQSENGHANIRVTVVNDMPASDSRKQLEAFFIETMDPQQPAAKPAHAPTYVIIRGNHARGQFVHWHGTLQSAKTVGILKSPARTSIAKRLLAGDSIVWLLVKSKDEKRNKEARELLSKSFASLSDRVKIPEGIGLPGSELHSEVPLLLRFSIVEVDPFDPSEQFLASVLSNLQPDVLEDGEPLVVPVFGRGRGLEVIPAADLNASLVEDLTVFLCGACSCQVKERNPGFDLLMAVAWEKELFGEEGVTPPEQLKTNPKANKRPVLLQIPPGRKKE